MLPRRKICKLPAWFTRAFCRACNGGWMAQLEEATRPVLGPMIRSRPTTLLGEREQRLLTLWATKTALAFQTMELTSTQWALPEDFATLHARSEPPPGSQVWLGAREQFYPAWYRAHSLSRDRSAIDVVDGYSVVLTVGFAVFFLIVSRDPQVQVRLRGEGALAMAPIWPRRREHVRWPPARLLAPIDLTRLPHRLLRDAALRPRGSEASG